MVINFDKDKIERLKRTIKEDFSKHIDGNGVLPYEFLNELKTGKGIYNFDIPVMKINEKVYPQNLFCGHGYYDDSLVMFLPVEYSSYGDIYRTAESEWIYGIKEKSLKGINPEDLNDVLKVEFNLRKNQYKILNIKGYAEKEIKAVKEKGE